MRTIAFVFIFKYGTYPILYEYCNQLAALHYNIHYIGLSDRDESYTDSNGVQVTHFDEEAISSPLDLSKKYNKALEQINPDLVHVFQFRWCVLLPLVAKFRWKWLLDVRTVHVGDRNGHYSRLTFLKNRLTWLESLAYNQSVALTRQVKTLLYPNRRTVPIIPLGANTAKFNPPDRAEIRQSIRTSLGVEPDIKVYLYSGTLNPNRKVEVVFNAFFQLLSQHEKSYLLVLGHDKDNKDTLEHYKTFCKQLGIAQQVHFTGHLPYHQVVQYYSASDIGISFVPLTSYFEYQPPTKLFEYMAAGLLPISTKSKATVDVISDGVNGFLITDDVQSLADAMAKTYELNESEKEEMLVQAHLTASEYDWHNIISKKLLPIYDQLLKS